MCGEHRGRLPRLLHAGGSSPHVRGTRAPSRARNHMIGIIPACAGNTDCPNAQPCGHWDHPRMCGEHADRRSHMNSNGGSSPHVRGTLEHGEPVGQVDGIIPACAGNTSPTSSPARAPRDHPRMCGEHPISHIPCDVTEGSSPHVRGTQSHSRGRA